MRLKKFKLKNILIVSMLAIAGLFSAASFIVANNANNKPINEVKAEDRKTKIYFKILSEWNGTLYSNIRVCFFNSNQAIDNDNVSTSNITGTAWPGSELSYDNEKLAYYASVPSDAKSVIFSKNGGGNTGSGKHRTYISEIPLSTSSNDTYYVSSNYRTVYETGWSQSGYWDCLKSAGSVEKDTKFFIDISGYPGWKDHGKFQLNFYTSSGNTVTTSKIDRNSQFRDYVYMFTVPNTYDTYTRVQAYRTDAGTYNKETDVLYLLENTNSVVICGEYGYSSLQTIYGVESGETIYINYENVNWWDNNDPHQFIYFYDPSDGSYDIWCDKGMAYVQKAGYNLIEATVPYHNGNKVTYYSAIGVRCHEDHDKSFDNRYNQTVTFHPISNSKSGVQNVMKLTGGTSGSDYVISTSDSYNISSVTRASIYAEYFLDQIKCTGTSPGAITTPSTNWIENMFGEYGHLSPDVKTVIQNKIGVKEGGEDKLATAVYRYDFIIKKYGTGTYNDFIGRMELSSYSFRSSKLVSPLLGDDGDMISTIIIVASSLSLISITALSVLLVKKRKRTDINQ